jgi:hypothetical protein
LLVGNAFIVFGGDTKMDEGDLLDDTLYLLNTCKLERISLAIVMLILIQPQNNGQEPCRRVLDLPADMATP